MHIINQTIKFLNQSVFPVVSARHQGLFRFGVSALTLQSFTSLNSNARMVITNRSTAQSKIFRLVSNTTIPAYFTHLMSRLRLVTPTDVVNVDFSSFCGFEVLTFAKQTRLGRAIPLYFEFIRYPITDPGSQTRFVMKAIQHFQQVVGFCPKLVFDRGFESPYIVPFLVTAGITFYLRMRKDKHVLYQEKDIPLRNLPWYEKDTMVTIYEDTLPNQLRVVASEKLSERKDSQGKEEPWYILTNDFHTPKETIIATYYFRFEIEETFKDLKHINKLKKFFQIKKELTFTILLWFSILTMWLAFLLTATKTCLITRITQKKRKKLSVTRFFFESLQQAKNILFQETFAM
jgi:hypothetical protein